MLLSTPKVCRCIAARDRTSSSFEASSRERHSRTKVVCAESSASNFTACSFPKTLRLKRESRQSLAWAGESVRNNHLMSQIFRRLLAAPSVLADVKHPIELAERQQRSHLRWYGAQ